VLDFSHFSSQLFILFDSVLPDALKQRVRSRLMKLNRAVCLECPEFHIPWFHERYCQRVFHNSK